MSNWIRVTCKCPHHKGSIQFPDDLGILDAVLSTVKAHGSTPVAEAMESPLEGLELDRITEIKH